MWGLLHLLNKCFRHYSYYRVIQPTHIDDTVRGLKQNQKWSTLSKVPTKVTVAKKLLNKKIQLNTHVKFDADQSDSELSGDENDLVSSTVSEESMTPLEIDHYQSTASSMHTFGGIEMSKARESLQASDRMDRARERERVKAIHRELKRKGNPLEKVSSQSLAVLRLPSDSGSESEGEEATLGLKEPIKKRMKVDNERKRKIGEEQLGTEALPVTLCEDEELALHLLNS